MKTTTRYSPEFRQRAVRMVFEHQGEHKTQWAAIVSIATKIYLRATSQASNVQTEIFLTNKTSRSHAVD
jgi:transposase-like protein